ncbi:sensor histidine kinase [Actinokineospora enzanensis]|uniref:sensor histidine kinase n=1 Tax=Actinokineospora enzanensis TaxID=155975 RepID=UPI001B7F8F5E|nr:sensor histidine kinase [Actinokineospora enzanensis]
MSVHSRLFLGDVLLAVVLTGLTMVNLLGTGTPPLTYLLAALATAPIAVRQRAPVGTLAVILASVAAYSLSGYHDFPGGGVGVLIGVFTVATLRSRSTAAVAWVAAVAVTLANIRSTGSVSWPEGARGILVVLGAWVLGEGTKRWGQRIERLAEQSARAVADERGRIARELHDIVAHHMSVISLQAGLARYVLDTDPPTARTALDTVGDSSRAALTDMRRLLDVLRVDHTEDTDWEAESGPGLASLTELVDRMRAAGLPVEMVVHGRSRALPPGPDTCAYRVVQESLTNVLKHAGQATARIGLDYGDRALLLRITDDGVGAGPLRIGPDSHGIRGMRERVELFGGTFSAGPAEGGGFVVAAELPMTEPAQPGRDDVDHAPSD